ncbi:MAG: hypothetical protein J7L61_01515 [Thermoplasmata archaeon]|nr:hypothetical protein [Thermoplasmata archaeon]
MSRKKRLKRKREARGIARERIDILFGLAEEEALHGDMERAARYVHLLRKIGMRYNVPVPHRYRLHICRGCDSFLVPGKNARVRLSKYRVRVECLSCGRVQRFPYLREKRGDKRRQERETGNERRR